MTISRLEFCRHFIYLQGAPISFCSRPYLETPYGARSNRIVLRASRQVEKSTFVVNAILHAAVAHPGIHIVVVFPRETQLGVFSKSRLQPTLEQSPVLRRALLGSRPRRLQVGHLQLVNKSEIYLRAAYHSADAARGIDGDFLVIDEFQDISSGSLPVLEECLSHSRLKRVMITGTPKTVDNHLESVFAGSTACEWRVRCTGCGEEVILDERCLGSSGPICYRCNRPIDPRAGHWVPRNPDSTWGEGYWLNHLMVSWVDYAELMERRRTYDPGLFKNECLGLPVLLGDHIVTRAELEACCDTRPMAQSLQDIPRDCHDRLLAGIDWGGGGVSRTVLVIGYMQDNGRFVVSYLERLPASEEPKSTLEKVASRLAAFGVRMVAADGGGNGSVYNSLLLQHCPQLAGLYGMFYSEIDHPPQQYKGPLWRWTVGRTPTIGNLFGWIKQRRLCLPCVADCGSYLDEICCEVAQYD